jgi:hypothetical protein
LGKIILKDAKNILPENDLNVIEEKGGQKK